jgi:predicted Zn-dependent peptidase
MKRSMLGSVALVATAAVGCSSTSYTPRELTNVSIPVKDTTPKPRAAATSDREPPPASGPAREFHFPKTTWAELDTGLKVAAIESRALPIVQIRVVVLGGKAADGERPGLSAMTGALLKDGGAAGMSSRDVLTKIESLGANLSIDTGFDETVLGLAVTKDHLSEAMGLLAGLVQSPQLNQAEFDKLKKRESNRVADSARTSGRWAASMILWRDLFTLPADRHPYASFDATPADIQNITLAECRAFHKKHYVPKNTFVVVAGDTTPAAAQQAVEKAFGGYKGGEAPVLSFTDPNPPESLRITLVDRPKSSQSDVFVATLGPARVDAVWPRMAVANQVLGGGPSGRLFLDVREKQSLAYAARSSLVEVAKGPAPLIAYAGTQTPKTGLALRALLDHMTRLGATVPSDVEVQTATRYLSDVFAIKIETIGAVADELVHLKTLGLPDDHYDGYRKDLLAVTPNAAADIAAEHVREGHAVVVVAGDAAVIGPMMSHFGDVKVVDPTKGFERVRTISFNPQAALEAPRAAGQ